LDGSSSSRCLQDLKNSSGLSRDLQLINTVVFLKRK
jgi:hypothetical protein